MLTDYLTVKTRNPSPSAYFEVADITEGVPTLQDAENELISRYLDARYGVENLARLAASLGWADIQSEIIKPGLPRVRTMKRGVYGEVLFMTYLEEVDLFQIPVPKLRFQISGDQSLPGLDILAFRFDDDSVVEACYCECKLRTNVSNTAALVALDQLEDAYRRKLPDILLFTALRLRDNNSAIAEAVEEYMASRRTSVELDSFRIALAYDISAWRERVLSNVDERAPNMNPLLVMALRAASLVDLTDSFFENLGVDEVVEDD